MEKLTELYGWYQEIRAKYNPQHNDFKGFLICWYGDEKTIAEYCGFNTIQEYRVALIRIIQEKL